MWANAQPHGRPAKYRWRPVLNAAIFGSRPLLDCRAVTLTQSEFCTWQNSITEQQLPKMYIQSTSQVRAKQCTKFGWLLLSDVAAVMKPRHESC